MKNLVLSSIILILFCGCSSKLTKGLQPSPEPVINTDEIIPWFPGQNDHFLFQTNINIYKNHFGGIMVIKSLSKDSHRVVYVTEIGIKIFDMEFFRNGEFKLHYCLDAINKKFIINTLRKDIGLLLESIPKGDKMEFWKDSDKLRTVIRFKDKNGLKYYMVKVRTKKVEEISVTEHLHKKMDMLFFSENGIDLDSVKMKHYSMKLNIQLSRLNETR